MTPTNETQTQQVHEVPPPPAATIDLLAKARILSITTPREYILACEAKLAIDDMIAEREGAHGPNKKRTYDAWKGATEFYNADMKPLLEAKKIFVDATDRWRRSQEAIVAQQARDRQLELDRAAEAEREEEIEQAEASGATAQEVQAIADRPVYVPPVVPMARPSTVPKIKGIRRKADNWKAMLDPANPNALADLIKFCSTNPGFQNLLELSERSANALATAQKTAMNIPGLRAYNAAV